MSFEQLHGPWHRLRPADAADLFDGLDAPWWIAGGWAIEVLSGVPRRHGDLDVCILERDVPLVVQHFPAVTTCGSPRTTASATSGPRGRSHPRLRSPRPKDLADLEVVLPLLDPDARSRLADVVRGVDPGHDWLEPLT